MWGALLRLTDGRMVLLMRAALGVVLVMGALVSVSWWSLRVLDMLEAKYISLLDDTYPVILAAQRLNTEVQTQAELVMAVAATREARLPAVQQSRSRAEGPLGVLARAGIHDRRLASRLAEINERRLVFNSMVDGVHANKDTLASQQLVLQADSARAIGELMGRLIDFTVIELQDDVADIRMENAKSLALARQTLRSALAIGLLAVLALAVPVVVTLLGLPQQESLAMVTASRRTP